MMLSIIIPAYRSEKFLEKNVQLVYNQAQNIGKDFEILIVTGKNPDKTLEIAKTIAERNSKVRVVESRERLGKGKALSLGFAKALGEIQVYTDADLEIAPKYILSIVEKIRQGNDIAIASKHNPESDFKSPFIRKFLGKNYNILVRVLLGGGIHDYQGGMKGFTKKAIKKILPYVKDEWWFWDTEALIIAQWTGLSIGEVPIKGSYGFRGSTINIFSACINLFKSILSLKKRRLTELKNLGKN